MSRHDARKCIPICHHVLIEVRQSDLEWRMMHEQKHRPILAVVEGEPGLSLLAEEAGVDARIDGIEKSPLLRVADRLNEAALIDREMGRRLTPKRAARSLSEEAWFSTDTCYRRSRARAPLRSPATRSFPTDAFVASNCVIQIIPVT